MSVALYLLIEVTGFYSSLVQLSRTITLESRRELGAMKTGYES